MEQSSRLLALPLNKLLRIIVSPSTTPQEKTDAVYTISATLSSPKEILNSETIPENHQFKAEARFVLDAFETAANGVHDPLCLTALETIGEASFFAPWKYAIHALHAFYNANSADFYRALSKIQPDCAVFAIRRELETLWKSRETNRSESRLSAKVYPKDGSMEELIEEFSEASDEGVESVFLRSASRILKEFSTRSRKAAVRFASYAMAKADTLDLAPDELFSIITRVLGDSDSFRIAAVYFRDSRPDLSCLFWLKSTAKALEDAPIPVDLLAARFAAAALAAEGSGTFISSRDEGMIPATLQCCRDLLSLVSVVYPGLIRLPVSCQSISECAAILGSCARVCTMKSLESVKAPKRTSRRNARFNACDDFDLFSREHQ